MTFNTEKSNYLGGLLPNPVLLPQRRENSKITPGLRAIFVPLCLCGKNLLAQLNSYKKTLLFLLPALLGAAALSAQETFQGTVEYKYEMKGEGAEMMAAFMPEKMVVKYSEKSMLTYMEGGMMGDMMGRIVVNGESGENFVVKDDEQAIYLIKAEDIEEKIAGQEEPKLEKLDEQKDILGYACRRYKLTLSQDGAETVQYMWITGQLRAPEIKTPGAGQMGGFISTTDIPGFPMEVEVEIPQSGMTLLLSAVNIDQARVPASEFERPEGYEVKGFEEMMQKQD